jgi:methyl-accepting chemotaxis protein
MPLELSDEMYERLVALVTDARVAAQGCQREVALLREERDRDYKELKRDIDNIKAASQMLVEGFRAVEEDLTEVQSALREHSGEFKEVNGAFKEQAIATEMMAKEINSLATAVDGISQLTKSNFDQLESFRKHVIDGESSGRIGHGEEASGRPQ